MHGDFLFLGHYRRHFGLETGCVCYLLNVSCDCAASLDWMNACWDDFLKSWRALLLYPSALYGTEILVDFEEIFLFFGAAAILFDKDYDKNKEVFCLSLSTIQVQTHLHFAAKRQHGGHVSHRVASTLGTIQILYLPSSVSDPDPSLS